MRHGLFDTPLDSSILVFFKPLETLQPLETLHCYVLHTRFPLPGYLDDQHSEFLKLWLGYHGFRELLNLIEYYNTIINCTILKDEYNTIKIVHYLWTLTYDYLVYITQPKFREDTPNQILHVWSTLIMWSKILHYYRPISYPI